MNQNLTIDDKNFLTKIVKKIIELKLVTPAIFFLEMAKPLNFIGSQTMVFFGPIVSAFVKRMVIIGLQNYLKITSA